MAGNDFARCGPDELLRQIQQQEERAVRGRLKVFLGYAPHTGKSRRMFEEGLRRLQRGQDVVAGAIQRKGSDDLMGMISEFEAIPPLVVHGVETVDVDAILQRRPQVCLIDAVASSNPAGSRLPHRWQDVEEIRRAGIHVVVAVNLQHVREQQDAVERITGRRASSSVPASFLQSADEVVIVDVPSDQMAGTLQPAQLSELRELALLLAAQVVEEQLQRYMQAHGIQQSWGTQERILVCITPRSSARVMLESAAHATERFHGHMFVIHVKQGELPREAEETLRGNLEYARKRGAEVQELEGADAIAAILQFAREQRITQLFIGHTQRKRWTIWAPNPVDRLIRAAEGLDLRLFPQASAG